MRKRSCDRRSGGCLQDDAQALGVDRDGVRAGTDVGRGEPGHRVEFASAEPELDDRRRNADLPAPRNAAADSSISLIAPSARAFDPITQGR